MATTPPKVLFVEDEPLILFAAADQLRDEGLDVIEALDARQALIELEANPEIVAIVTDVNMPGDMDGLELTRTVKQQNPDLPVVITSGRPVDHLVPAGVPFVTKPYDLATLAKLVKELVKQ